MNRGLKSVIMMYRRDLFSWIYLPWMIMLSSFVVNLIIATSMQEEFTTGGLLSIFIYIYIVGLVTVNQTFSFALSLCISRRDYFAGSSLAIVVIALFHALLMTIVASIEKAVGSWGGMNFFVLPDTSDGPAWQTFFVFFIALLLMFFIGFASSSLSRRFGKKGNFILYGGAFVLGGGLTTIASLRGWWTPMYEWFIDLQPTLAGIMSVLLVFSAVLALLSWLMLRRSAVRA
ncbi:hypothetical protein M3223_22330 [Paenibacillus pasadenensis]|uniref:hypothetical protein n=1 Tax=Paenibacillus pasadenensis TaxID=217090 RepID=UPI00203A80B4|nr:hypothetical protein [Paenibacillus pasadenensis]MCM3750076.1 hypothetical protein [Paenibacillus pasadenensis]